MHDFHYRGNELFCEEVSLQQIVKQVGTPCYIYSHRTIQNSFHAFNDAFQDIPHIVAYAMKANSNIGVLRLLAKEGSGADIVSGGELFRALKAGIPSNKMVFAGVGKSSEEILYALKSDILMFNVESPEELQRINEEAKTIGVQARVALRINPDIDPQTHPYISTGLKKKQIRYCCGSSPQRIRACKSTFPYRCRGRTLSYRIAINPSHSICRRH